MALFTYSCLCLLDGQGIGCKIGSWRSCPCWQLLNWVWLCIISRANYHPYICSNIRGESLLLQLFLCILIFFFDKLAFSLTIYSSCFSVSPSSIGINTYFKCLAKMIVSEWLLSTQQELFEKLFSINLDVIFCVKPQYYFKMCLLWHLLAEFTNLI